MEAHGDKALYALTTCVCMCLAASAKLRVWGAAQGRRLQLEVSTAKYPDLTLGKQTIKHTNKRTNQQTPKQTTNQTNKDSLSLCISACLAVAVGAFCVVGVCDSFRWARAVSGASHEWFGRAGGWET